jgi:hypothetical protein
MPQSRRTLCEFGKVFSLDKVVGFQKDFTQTGFTNGIVL